MDRPICLPPPPVPAAARPPKPQLDCISQSRRPSSMWFVSPLRISLLAETEFGRTKEYRLGGRCTTPIRRRPLLVAVPSLVGEHTPCSNIDAGGRRAARTSL